MNPLCAMPQAAGRAAGPQATVGVGQSLTLTDICLCMVPVGFFLSIVSLV
jgi:hypothetical protein